MSDTPETDAASQSWLRIRTNGETFIDENKIVLADKMAAVERQLNEALQLARELRDALENCREDSIALASEWEWKRGAGTRNDRDMAEIGGNIAAADSILTKANQLLK